MKHFKSIIISVTFSLCIGIVQGTNPIIENDALKISFDTEVNGFGIMEIVNKLADNTSFALSKDKSNGLPTLWNIVFQRRKSDGGNEVKALKNYGFSAKTSFRLMELPELQRLVMAWEGLSLPGESQCVNVSVTVTLYAGDAPSNWTIKVENNSKEWSTSLVQFPFICNVAEKGTADILWPQLPLGGRIHKKNTASLKGTYPSWYCPVAFTAFNKGDAGLYIAAHDGYAGTKNLNLTSAQHFSFDIPAENSTAAGNNWSPDYPFVIAAYKGDWWQAARLYKSWANQQKWCGRGKLTDREKSPGEYYNVDFWLYGNMKLDQWAHPKNLERAVEETQKFFAPAKVGLYFNDQQVNKFDTCYPEYFPVMPGVAEVIEKLQAKNFVVMPYINAYLWDVSLPSFTDVVRKNAVHKMDGTIEQDPTPPGALSAYMCPYGDMWQEKIASICKRLVTELKVNAIYLDQLAGTRPKSCYEPVHGHPLGGGHYWADGFRRMLERIRENIAGSNVAITSEGCSDPYIDLLDGFLLGHGYKDGFDVPLLQVIYSGYTTFYGCLESRMDDIDAFAAYQGSSFIYGIQLGFLMRFNLGGLDDRSVGAGMLYGVDAFNGAIPEFKEIGNLLKYLAQYRHIVADFMTYGSLVDEVKFAEDMGTTSIDRYRHYFYKKGDIPATISFPVVGSAVWLNAGQDAMAIVLMNYTAKPRTVTFTQNVKRWLKTEDYTCQRVTLTETVNIQIKNGESFSQELSLDGREVAVFILRKNNTIQAAN